MNERQEKILGHIIDEHVRTAAPVGSEYLVSQLKLDVSGATVRNDCQVLEKQGYLTHPHTSAGRIPTAKGYEHYVSQKQAKQRAKSIVAKETKLLDAVYKKTKQQDQRYLIKQMAKMVAELARGTVLVGFERQDSYYTGLSHLFAQPEFQDHELVYNVSAIVDHLDDALAKVYSSWPSEVTVKVGSQNPFGADCSFVGARFKMGREARLFGLLGPMRMPYLENIGRVEYAMQLLSS